MYIPLTTAALALLTVAMFLLRIYWSRVPPRLKSILIRASIAMIVVHGLFVVTKWTTTSDRLNVLINWLAIAGYELLVLLFSRLSPRWLTIPSAAILLIPLFASSILIPLTQLFEPGSREKVPLGDHLFYEVSPWSNVGGGNAGVNVLIYYRPPFAPFIRHKLQTIPFNDQECNSNAASAVAFPAKKTVLGRCPNWPAHSAGTLDKLLPLR
ncbi:MAG TPA: hypothetical protein VH117_06965 [Edaphobacter sp.]|jgi:hypothetical protein|nr:hypothetical protein [Edaphobacter sp.]